jgi:hypothetical protein
VLPRPTSRMTAYLPILSGMRAAGLAGGTVFEAGIDMARGDSQTSREDKTPPSEATVIHPSRARLRRSAVHRDSDAVRVTPAQQKCWYPECENSVTVPSRSTTAPGASRSTPMRV